MQRTCGTNGIVIIIFTCFGAAVAHSEVCLLYWIYGEKTDKSWLLSVMVYSQWFSWRPMWLPRYFWDRKFRTEQTRHNRIFYLDFAFDEKKKRFSNFSFIQERWLFFAAAIAIMNVCHMDLNSCPFWRSYHIFFHWLDHSDSFVLNNNSD